MTALGTVTAIKPLLIRGFFMSGVECEAAEKRKVKSLNCSMSVAEGIRIQMSVYSECEANINIDITKIRVSCYLMVGVLVLIDNDVFLWLECSTL